MCFWLNAPMRIKLAEIQNTALLTELPLSAVAARLVGAKNKIEGN